MYILEGGGYYLIPLLVAFLALALVLLFAWGMLLLLLFQVLPWKPSLSYLLAINLLLLLLSTPRPPGRAG